MEYLELVIADLEDRVRKALEGLGGTLLQSMYKKEEAVVETLIKHAADAAKGIDPTPKPVFSTDVKPKEANNGKNKD